MCARAARIVPRPARAAAAALQERDCFTLVRPVDDEDQLQYVDSMTEDELRPEFRRQLTQLRLKVFGEVRVARPWCRSDGAAAARVARTLRCYAQMIRPKTMQGQFVTGRILGGLAQAYVAAINARAIPNIGNAWDGVSRVECKVQCDARCRRGLCQRVRTCFLVHGLRAQEALDAAYTAFASSLAAELPPARLPLNHDELERTFEKHRIRAIEAFDAKAVGPSTGACVVPGQAIAAFSACTARTHHDVQTSTGVSSRKKCPQIVKCCHLLMPAHRVREHLPSAHVLLVTGRLCVRPNVRR